jgi:hypothetical protein
MARALIERKRQLRSGDRRREYTDERAHRASSWYFFNNQDHLQMKEREARSLRGEFEQRERACVSGRLFGVLEGVAPRSCKYLLSPLKLEIEPY